MAQNKGTWIYMERHKKLLGEILYLTALALWLIVALIKYTYFKDMIPLKPISDFSLYGALLLLLGKLILDFRMDARSIGSLFLLILFVIIGKAGGKLSFGVMFALIYSAKNVSFKKILKLHLIIQIIVLASTVICSQIGILEDYIWEVSVRNRHGLGFTHCMLASHFGLYIILIYVYLVKKMTVLRAFVALAFNYVLFYFTDGRTDMYLAVLFVILAFCFGNLGQRLKGERVLAFVAALVPWVSLVASIVITKLYDPANATWLKLNVLLNNRLSLGQQAINEYGFTLFGQKISWVGASALYYTPDKVYNYVDNSYLMMMLTYGTVLVLGYCIAMSFLLYHKMRQKETMLVVCLVITLAFGMINPQSMYLTYNPFLVLLAQLWNPEKGIESPCKKNLKANVSGE